MRLKLVRTEVPGRETTGCQRRKWIIWSVCVCVCVCVCTYVCVCVRERLWETVYFSMVFGYCKLSKWILCFHILDTKIHEVSFGKYIEYITNFKANNKTARTIKFIQNMRKWRKIRGNIQGSWVCSVKLTGIEGVLSFSARWDFVLKTMSLENHPLNIHLWFHGNLILSCRGIVKHRVWR